MEKVMVQASEATCVILWWVIATTCYPSTNHNTLKQFEEN